MQMLARRQTEPAGAVRTTTRRRGARAVAVAAASFVVLVVALLALPGGRVVGDTTPNVELAQPLGPLQPGDEVVQTFPATEGRLAAVYATFGTYGGSAQCTLAVTLREHTAGTGAGGGPVVAENEVDCAALPDSGRFPVLELSPIADSGGRTYDLTIARVDKSPALGVALWTGPAPDAPDLILNGADQPGESALVRPEYDPRPHQWDHLGRSLSRLAAYGPGWGAPAAVIGFVLLIGALVSITPLTLRSSKALYLVVAALALVRGLLWSASVPALESMDEPAHVAYVQYLAEEHTFPGRVGATDPYSPQMLGAVELINRDAAFPGDRPPYTAAGEASVEAQIESLSPKGGGAAPGSMYAPFYYLGGVPLYLAGGDDLLTQVALIRLWSVAIGVVAAILTIAIGRRLFPGSVVAQTGFTVAAVLQPMLSHQFAVVNNDAWVIVWGFAALLVGLELARRARAPWLALLAGVVIGAALLGKPFAVAVVVPLGVGWLVGKVRARQRSLRVLLGEAALVVAGVAVTYGAWSLAAARLDLTTSEVPQHVDAGQTLSGFVHAQLAGWGDAPRAVWGVQLWGDFGRVRIPLPPPVPQVLLLIEVAVAIGLLAWVVVLLARLRRRGTSTPTPPLNEEELRSAPLPLDVRIGLVAATLVAIVGTLYAAAWVYYASTGRNDLIQGRYALLAVPALVASPALLVERFGRDRVPVTWVTTVMAAGMVAANLLGILVTFEGFYG